MAAHAILMPRLGMTMEEGTVLEWPIAVGSRVEKGQTILIIETEKAETEIEATESGYLRHIYVEPDAVVPCETLLAATTTALDDPFDPAEFQLAHPDPTPAADIAVPAAGAAARAQTAPERPKTAVAPAARAAAKKLGIDPERVTGSGPGGRVTKQDVEAFAAAREKLVEAADEVRLELLREGTGEPVLLLPGFGTDVSSFSAQSSALATRHEVLALNPRGIGASDAPPLDCYAVADAARDAAAILGDGSAHIVGASLGAAVAIELALTFPARVRSLVLITPLVEVSTRLASVVEVWARLAAETNAETTAQALAPWLFGDALLEDPKARERTLRGLAQMLGRIPAETLPRAAAGLLAWSGTRKKEIAQISVPTMVVSAGADLLTPDGPAIAAAIPGARHRSMEGAGHAVSIDAAEAVTRAVQEFLSDDPAR